MSSSSTTITTRSQSKLLAIETTGIVEKYNSMNNKQKQKVASHISSRINAANLFLKQVELCTDKKYNQLLTFADRENIIGRYSVSGRDEFLKKLYHVPGTDLNRLMSFWHTIQ